LTSGDDRYHEPWNDDDENWVDIGQLVLNNCQAFFDLYLSYPNYVWTPLIWTTIGTRTLFPLYSLDCDFLDFLTLNEHYTTDTD
jgi:hypothetical protein